MRQLLQPIAEFVYCNRQMPHAGATRPPAAGDRLNAPVNSTYDDANRFDRQLNSAHSLKLFHYRQHFAKRNAPVFKLLKGRL